MGVGTGLLASAGSIAAPVASIVGGSLSEVYGPRVIFAVMAVTVVAAIAFLPLVKIPAEVAVSEAASGAPSGPAEGVPVARAVDPGGY